LVTIVAAAFAEVVVDVDHCHRLGLQVVGDVARHLGHRRVLREAGAEDIRVALLGDRRGLAAGEVGDLGARVSAMLTRIEPEKTGPNTANTPSSTAFCARPLATPGLLCVSAVVISMLAGRGCRRRR
jgi:hypothetical protein